MKIAFIVSSLSMGGVQKITVRIANELAKQPTNHVEIIALKGTKAYYDVQTPMTFLDIYSHRLYKTIRKVTHSFLNHFALSNQVTLKVLNQHFQEHDYDVVIASDGYVTMLANELKLIFVKKKVYHLLGK